MLKRKIICAIGIAVLGMSMVMNDASAASREDEISLIALMLAGVPQESAAEMVKDIPEQGDKGEHILKIKKQLQKLGYYSATATFSDEFNSTMTERLKMFQRNNGLTVTGRYDIRTEMKMTDGQNLVTGEWYVQPSAPTKRKNRLKVRITLR